jgi:hypothetical protein
MEADQTPDPGLPLKKRSGRAEVLTVEKREQIVGLIALGASNRMAAMHAGCAPNTIRNTAERHPAFQTQIDSARVRPEVNSLKKLNKAGDETRHWRLHAWMLERRWPEQFALRKPGTVTTLQMHELLEKVMAIVMQEVSKEADKKRIALRFETVLAELLREQDAEDAP